MGEKVHFCSISKDLCFLARTSEPHRCGEHIDYREASRNGIKHPEPQICYIAKNYLISILRQTNVRSSQVELKTTPQKVTLVVGGKSLGSVDKGVYKKAVKKK